MKKIIIYFIGGTTFSADLNENGLNEIVEMLENKEMLEKYNNIIRIGNKGINVANINAYEILDESEDNKWMKKTNKNI